MSRALPLGGSVSGESLEDAGKRLGIEPKFDDLTHYLFRYPAKFHPPVVRSLLEKYSKRGDQVLDPFVGSGTALVEASTMGRPSIGVDVDPLAVVISRAKVRTQNMTELRARAALLLAVLERARRPRAEYVRRQQVDLTDRQFTKAAAPIAAYIPEIPNVDHWFRRYVTIDLARICLAIAELRMYDHERLFFDVVFASIIRNASNADPVPVSGLEVTSHMKKRDAAGRIVDPFDLFERALTKSLKAVEAFSAVADKKAPAEVLCGDAAHLTDVIDGEATLALTSPPYHGAVEYYRRHQLEHFWLGLTETQDDRLRLLDRYIGRPKVPKKHSFVADGVLRTALAKEWETRIRDVAPDRADAFRHYMVAMTSVFDELSKCLISRGRALLVVGHSTWNSAKIPTTELFTEIAGDAFELETVLWYPVKNRYMSYARKNEADISTEYVLVMRRSS